MIPQRIVAILKDVKDLLYLMFDLLIKLNGLVGVDGVDCVSDQFIDVFCLVDAEFLQNLLIIQDAFYDIELLPFYEDLAVS